MSNRIDEDMFALARQYFSTFLQEFGAYGIEAEPGMELRPGSGLLCYYDFKDGHIYLSIPDFDEPTGKLQLLFLRSLLKCESNEDLWQFAQVFIPHLVAHELAHHFRHRYGLFTDNPWHEEQVANQLATAVTKHRLTPELKDLARKRLPQILESLSKQIGSQNTATDSYHDVLQALNASGQIGEATMDNLEMVQKLFAINPEEVLKSSGHLSPEMLQRLDNRDEIIDSINEQYASDYMRYFYYHLGWLYLALTSRETQYVEEFVRLHLNRRVDLLPILPTLGDPEDQAIQACFRAYQTTQARSAVGSRYFYKRYRSLLLAKLQHAESLMPSQTEQLKKEAAILLESWTEHESDSLTYLAQLAPPALRLLFPHLIADNLDPKLPLQLHLPSETDLRLWKHIYLREKDEGAVNTLYRLGLLEETDIYRPLPAEVLLELTHNLCRIKLAAGETIIWEGDINDDVYILIEGQLEALVTTLGRQHVVGTIRPGEVFGEMAFFTRKARKATVRAAGIAECFVLKDSDLRLFGYKHPSILIQMAGVLARRLAQLNTTRASQTNTSFPVDPPPS